MHSKYFVINNRCNWEAIEAVSEGLPQFNVIPPLTLIIESINPIDRGTLMVSSKKEEILGILNFVS